jgi:hypothetical protein
MLKQQFPEQVLLNPLCWASSSDYTDAKYNELFDQAANTSKQEAIPAFFCYHRIMKDCGGDHSE